MLCQKIEKLEKALEPLPILKQIENSAKSIKEEICSMSQTYQSWPPSQNDLVSCKTVIPPLLSTFSSLLLTSKKRVGKRKKSRINSICQDIIYTTTNGRMRTSKHVTVALSIKRKTGSKDIITWLNRYGHIISYDEINFVETDLAEQIMKNKNLRSFVPSQVQQFRFVSFIWDNNDVNPESLKGKSMHVTNGIIVQLAEEGDVSFASTSRRECAGRKRSFQAIEISLPSYISKKRNDYKIVGSDLSNVTIDQAGYKLSKLLDFFWVVLRYHSDRIPNWAGFNYELNLPTSSSIHTVSYLPAINASPTNMDTVLELLYQSKAKAEYLNLPNADVVVDQAIYAKAVEILNNPNFSSLKDFIILRMGGFHIALNFLSVIGKRFGDAGIRDWIIGAGMGIGMH